MDGNAIENNCLGFIIPKDKVNRDNKYFDLSHIYYSMNNDYYLRKTNVDKIIKIRRKNNCWICEGYLEVEFEYVPEKPLIDPNNHLVKIHFDFDGYKPFDMLYNGNKYQIIRMCPPGEVKYFFTVDPPAILAEYSAN